jgi:3-hydroxyisobutyrate dehydrogenase
MILGRRFFSTGAPRKAGFIGLGNMGLPMAKNMLKAGWQVSAFDLNPEACALAEAAGAEIVAKGGHTAKDADFVITMLPNTTHVIEARTGDDGIYANAKEGAIIVDSSTISPIVSQKMGQEETGFVVADAPVSGGVPGAENGTLTFMVGCEKDKFEDVKECLAPMAGNTFYCGVHGAGQTAKICNNLSLALEMIAVSEGLSLGAKLGMDSKVLSDILSVSTGRCWSVDTYNPVPGVMEGVPASRGYAGGFGVSLLKKDLGIVLDSAEEVGAGLEFTEKAHEYFTALEKNGFGGKDFGVVYQYIHNNRKT